jgi:putative hydroxymethylpyrimidine transport system ATP-binding protein
VTERLEVRGLCKSFGDLEVLRDIDLAVDASESVAILGPSGCGKTTLLRILLGLESPDAGAVSRVVDRAGYLPQGSLLFPWKRVLENIELPLQVRGIGKDERRGRIRSHIECFGLEGFERAFPHQLSGGMQQRVALLRAVVAGAPLLLLDEPFGALDTVTRHRLQDWLARIREQLGGSLIFVTHDLDEAIILARRVLVLSNRPATVLGQIAPELGPQVPPDRLSRAFLDARESLVQLIVRGGMSD